MTALGDGSADGGGAGRVSWADVAHPLTTAEYRALPGDPEVRYELQEGAIVLPGRPIPDHQDYLGGLYVGARQQAPQHLKVLMEVDLDLELLPPDQPGTVRVPDLVVVAREAFLRVRRDGGLLTAADAVLAVELLSRGTRRTDTHVKHSEYADAGIPHYWMIDLDPDNGPSLTACHLAGAFGYQNAAPVHGVFATDAPFPVRLDLDDLT